MKGERAQLLDQLAQLSAGDATRRLFRRATIHELRQAIASAQIAEAARRRYGSRLAAMWALEGDYVPDILEAKD